MKKRQMSKISGEEEFSILLEIWGETKDQYNVFLDGFHDVKMKAQIYLVVCSLFLTLPFLNDKLLDIVFTAHPVTQLLVGIGVACLVLTIFTILQSLLHIRIHILEVGQVYKTLNDYKPKNVLKGMIENYLENLKKNRRLQNDRSGRWLVIAEILLRSGMLFIAIGVVTLWVV